MHAVMQLVAYWAVAFFSLGIAVVLLNIYSGWIGHDLELGSLVKETTIAGLASLIEAAGLWLILSFAPGALRAMIFPVIVAALIYKLAHFEDWSRFHILMLLFFQIVLVFAGGSLIFGRFQAALVIWVGFVFILGLVAAIMRNL